VVACVLLAAAVSAEEPERLVALAYHDVVTTAVEAQRDPTAVTVDTLVQQFAWLRGNGYQPVDLDTWLVGGEALPKRPVLLTFDDGYASFHTHVLPLLRLFGFPAVLAPVTAWIDTPDGSAVDYGGEWHSRDRFLTWAQLADVAASGLVEVATHTHDLHRGVIGNPNGNLQPAAVTRLFDPQSGSYETEDAQAGRVRRDLVQSLHLFEQHLGDRPRTIAWPYGRYTASTQSIAEELGLRIALTLDDAKNVRGSTVVHRLLIGSDMNLSDFAAAVRDLTARPPLRAAQIDLDYVYDDDPAQAERNLGMLLDRVKSMGLSAVFLQAFADPDGDGVAQALYFPNRHLPMRADLFNRVAWQLRTRANVAVFAWMPVLAFELPDHEQNAALAVRPASPSTFTEYHRLSPFHPDARRIVGEIYEDLGRAGAFDGVLFHDDAFLGDSEDASPAALAHYRDVWALSPGDEGITRRKTEFLGEFTDSLAAILRAYTPTLKTARNLYARAVLEPESEDWLAQSFADFQRRYDYTVVMAMPFLERAPKPEAWLRELVEHVRREPGAMARTVFQLQTVDWRTGERLPSSRLAMQFDLLLERGVRHVAYYPDDFVAGHPAESVVRSRISVNDYPALAR